MFNVPRIYLNCCKSEDGTNTDKIIQQMAAIEKTSINYQLYILHSYHPMRYNIVCGCRKSSQTFFFVGNSFKNRFTTFHHYRACFLTKWRTIAHVHTKTSFKCQPFGRIRFVSCWWSCRCPFDFRRHTYHYYLIYKFFMNPLKILKTI